MSVYTNDEFITRMHDSALTALLWSETDEYGKPLDEEYEDTDIDESTRDELMVDCEDFFGQHWQILASLEPSQVGYDFVLTRNGHGTGFWDRGFPQKIRETLTAASKVYGGINLYPGDDGVLYGG